MLKAGLTAEDIAALGIANQRETTILWTEILVNRFTMPLLAVP